MSSEATKRKYVSKEVTYDYVLPEDGLQIVRVLNGKGGNLHEVEDHKGQCFLVSMPTKFRKNVWIKRGDFVMIKEIAEGDKVKGEIEHILYKPQVDYIVDQGLWPKEFNKKGGPIERLVGCIPDDMLPPETEDSDSSASDDEERADTRTQPAAVCNPNWRKIDEISDDDDEEEDTDDDDKDDDTVDALR